MTGGNGIEHNLTLTAKHHLPVGDRCCASLVRAEDINVGDTVWTAFGATQGRRAQPAVVSRVVVTKSDGLHSPVLVAGGFPLVDGVVTAFDRIEMVSLASYALPYALGMCKATGTCELLRRATVDQL